ncbi:MAG TPA: hypothetical protein VIH42_04975 [Thermoguttaceae bacterium]
MINSENVLIMALILTNLAAGFGFAIPLAGLLAKTAGQHNKIMRYFVLLVGVYFLECVAFPLGMCTQIFTFALAVVWGIVLGLWLRDKTESQKAIKVATAFSLYGCAPTISFAVCLSILWLIAGKGLFNAQQAGEFGIPQFVPWPFNTMLGFCAGLVAGTIMIKIAITSGLVKWLVRHSKQVAGMGAMK